MATLDDSIQERVEACLGKQQRLTLGEVELLRALGGRPLPLSFLEEIELRHIERKLRLGRPLRAS